MPLANRRTLDPASQTSNHQGAATLNRPGPVPCQWRNAGPMLLADDSPPCSLLQPASQATAQAHARTTEQARRSDTMHLGRTQPTAGLTQLGRSD
jgi:hypothetical protein